MTDWDLRSDQNYLSVSGLRTCLGSGQNIVPENKKYGHIRANTLGFSQVEVLK